MANVDEYKRLKTKEKDELFIELFTLKQQKSKLEKQIKELESQYKSDLDGVERDLFYELSNGIKFSIKRSQRAGSIDSKRIEAELNVDINNYRKPSTTIYTLREDK